MTNVCAIAGGSGAGKTTLANEMLTVLGDQATHITIDWYYRDLSHLSPADRDAVNFDHPDSLEVDLFVSHLNQLRAGEPVHAPVYDFASHTRTSETVDVTPKPIIITEGIHLLGLDEVRTSCDLLVFIDVPAALRLERRVRRDVRERGRTPASVTAQWERTVAPMHDQFVEPSKAWADVVIGADEDLGVVAQRLADQLAVFG